MGWSALQARDFLTLEDARRGELKEVLDLARTYCVGAHAERPLAGKTARLAFFEASTRPAASPADPPLAGEPVCLAFFEASPRTAASFELAARRAGADVISISGKGSAIEKGEALVDSIVALVYLGAGGAAGRA